VFLVDKAILGKYPTPLSDLLAEKKEFLSMTGNMDII